MISIDRASEAVFAPECEMRVDTADAWGGPSDLEAAAVIVKRAEAFSRAPSQVF